MGFGERIIFLSDGVRVNPGFVLSHFLAQGRESLREMMIHFRALSDLLRHSLQLIGHTLVLRRREGLFIGHEAPKSGSAGSVVCDAPKVSQAPTLKGRLATGRI
jgi:hypothetical protein